MNETLTIAERIVTYYNDLIENNVISGKAPVTLEWMKRQRILEGRGELDLRFGHVTVDSILGEKTPLAKAEDMLMLVREKYKYELLPDIACLLAEECTEVLDPFNNIRFKYSSLNSTIHIPVFEITEDRFDFVFLKPSMKFFSIDDFRSIIEDVQNGKYERKPFKELYFEYIMKSAFSSLQIAFKEIRGAVKAKAKKENTSLPS